MNDVFDEIETDFEDLLSYFFDRQQGQSKRQKVGQFAFQGECGREPGPAFLEESHLEESTPILNGGLDLDFPTQQSDFDELQYLNGPLTPLSHSHGAREVSACKQEKKKVHPIPSFQSDSVGSSSKKRRHREQQQQQQQQQQQVEPKSQLDENSQQTKGIEIRNSKLNIDSSKITVAQADLETASLAPLRVVGSFDEDAFYEKYQRNNKCSGLKNLRCFPNCGPVHRERKFCGQPIMFRTVQDMAVKCEYNDSAEKSGCVSLQAMSGGKELVAWGRFGKSDFEDSGVQVGSVVLRKNIIDEERQRGKPFNLWYPSKVVRRRPDGKAKEVVEFQFNSENQGWHYAWQATKYTCNVEHVFKAYVFTPVSETHLLCCGIFESPRFTIYCRRRQRWQRINAEKSLSSVTVESRLLWFVLSHMEKVHLKQSDPDDDSASVSSSASSMDNTATAPSSPAGSTPTAATSSHQRDRQRKLRVVFQAFARHIVEETEFTDKISALSEEISFRRDRGESVDKGFRLFLECMRDYISGYFKKRGFALRDLCDLDAAAAAAANLQPGAAASSSLTPQLQETTLPAINIAATAGGLNAAKPSMASPQDQQRPEMELRSAFLDMVDAKSSAAKSLNRKRRSEQKVLEEITNKKMHLGDPVLEFNPEQEAKAYLEFSAKNLASTDKTEYAWTRLGWSRSLPLDIAGDWLAKRDSIGKIQMNKLRESFMPCVRRRLLQSMESQVRLEHDESALKCNLKPKLLSDGFILYPFDGQPRPFDFQDPNPIMGAAAPMALTKQAFVLGNAAFMRHSYSSTARMTRVLFKGINPNELQVIAYYETRDPNHESSPWTPKLEIFYVLDRQSSSSAERTKVKLENTRHCQPDQ